MTREQALTLLRLTPDADLTAAEQVYSNLQSNILQHVQSPSTDPTYRAKLEVALKEFSEAIETIRQFDSLGAGSIGEPVPENWWEDTEEDATGSASSETPQLHAEANTPTADLTDNVAPGLTESLNAKASPPLADAPPRDNIDLQPQIEEPSPQEQEASLESQLVQPTNSTETPAEADKASPLNTDEPPQEEQEASPQPQLVQPTRSTETPVEARTDLPTEIDEPLRQEQASGEQPQLVQPTPSTEEPVEASADPLLEVEEPLQQAPEPSPQPQPVQPSDEATSPPPETAVEHPFGVSQTQEAASVSPPFSDLDNRSEAEIADKTHILADDPILENQPNTGTSQPAMADRLREMASTAGQSVYRHAGVAVTIIKPWITLRNGVIAGAIAVGIILLAVLTRPSPDPEPIATTETGGSSSQVAVDPVPAAAESTTLDLPRDEQGNSDAQVSREVSLRNWQITQSTARDHATTLQGLISAMTPEVDQQVEQAFSSQIPAILQQYIADDAYLEQLMEISTLNFPESPTGGASDEVLASEQLVADAGQRIAYARDLELALQSRDTAMEQIIELENQGLPLWPPDPEEASALTADVKPEEIIALVSMQVEADQLLTAGDFRRAYQDFEELSSMLALVEVLPQQTPESKIEQLYQQGLRAINRQRLTLPAQGSAIDYVRQIEAITPGHPQAADILQRMQAKYIALSRDKLNDGDFDRARELVERSVAVTGESEDTDELLREIKTKEAQLASSRFKPLQEVIEFQDLAMVAIPTGDFTMGLNPTTMDRFSNFLGSLGTSEGNESAISRNEEHPVHYVVIDQPIAVSVNEITVGQFGAFVEETGYVTDAERAGASIAYFQTADIDVARTWREDYLGNAAEPNMPVIYVSFNDATAYARWFSDKTGAVYRLPSESEFEYAVRAGNTGSTPWLNNPPPANAGNFRGQLDTPPPTWGDAIGNRPVRTVRGYGDGSFGPAAVDTFDPNIWGLESMLGNVSEWTADCHTPGYEGKGQSQAARSDGNCDYRIVRGTDWASDSRQLRVTFRQGQPEDYSSNRIGFRLVREL